MKVGLDIDGVCCDMVLNFNSRMQRLHGYKHMPPSTWDWWDQYPDGRKHWVEYLSAEVASDEFRVAPTVRGTIPGLKVLEHRKVDLVFVTYRPAHSLEATVEWLTGLGVKDPQVVCTADKNDAEWDLMFDDHGETIDRLRLLGRRAYLFDQPYNTHFRLPRVKGWPGLLATVDQLSAGWHS